MKAPPAPTRRHCQQPLLLPFSPTPPLPHSPTAVVFNRTPGRRGRASAKSDQGEGWCWLGFAPNHEICSWVASLVDPDETLYTTIDVATAVDEFGDVCIYAKVPPAAAHRRRPPPLPPAQLCLHICKGAAARRRRRPPPPPAQLCPAWHSASAAACRREHVSRCPPVCIEHRRPALPRVAGTGGRS